jgi:hypothetical protein
MPAGISHAAGVLGEIWQNDSAATNASIVPSGAPDAEFYSSGINYDSGVSGYSPKLFLDAPSFFNLSGNFNPTGSLDNTFIRVTGQVYLNAGVNAFSVPHDDGTTLDIAGIGLVLDQPGPTSAVTNQFNVTAPSAGLYDFTLQGSVAQFAGQNGTFQQQAGETVTRGDRRRRELEARSSSPPLACLLLECLATSGGNWWSNVGRFNDAVIH